MIEVGYHRVANAKLIRREDKLIRPSIIFLQQTVGAHSCLCGLGHTGAHQADMMSGSLRGVHQVAAFLTDKHLLGVHLVLRQVFHLNVMEVAQCAMERQESKVDTLNFHTLQHLTAEMESRCGCRHSTLILGKETLEIVHILRSGRATIYNVMRQRGLTQGKEFTFELIVGTVIEETERTAAARRIVDDFCHHRSAVVEEQFVTDTDLTGRLHKHIPQAHLLIEFTQQEHLYLGIGLFLRTIETSRKHLRIIEHERIALVEMIQHVAEVKIHGIPLFVFQRFSVFIGLKHVYLLRLTVQNHQFAFVPMERRIQCNLLLGQFEFKLRQFHIFIILCFKFQVPGFR